MSQSKHYLERELEELIQSDPAIWRFIRKGSLDGIWYWDLEKPEHEYMSPEFWELFGFDPATKEHRVDEWQDLIFQEDLEVAKENLEKHIADPEHPYDQIVRYRCADGSTAWVRCRGLAIRDESGKAVRLLGAHNDITKLEQDVQSSHSLLTQVMDTARSAIIALDGTGRIVSINSAGRHFLGGISTTVPFSWPDAVTFIDQENMQPLEPIKDPVVRSLSGSAINGEVFSMSRAHARDARYVRVSTAPVEMDPSLFSCVMILDDVSEQEQHRQQVERTSRLDALGQLTGGIAHDFNNLLATVQYALELAEVTRDASKRQSYITTAKKSVERGSELTKRLLAFAKQQPGLATSQDVASIIGDFQKLSAPLIEATINVDFRISEDDMWVFCDVPQLGNALLNLLLNARDAILRSNTGNQITVLVRGINELDADVTLRREHANTYIAKGLHAEHQDEQERANNTAFRYIEFAVTDNGPGMTEEIKRRAVDPFFTTKATNSGTGLGLSMVYGFVQQANGELRIYSEPEQGTTVRLILPRGTQSGEREASLERKTPLPGKGELVLIVEDEISLLMMAEDLIGSLGYVTETARIGQEALELVEKLDIDLVITDIVMPGGMDGFEIARSIRKIKPDLPLLYMSGYTGYSEADMGGVVAPMLQKPCPPHELAAAIHHAIGRTADETAAE